jgi:hypothetical protein
MELSELGKQAEALYQRFRPQLETEENIGKIVVFDVDSEDYELDATGIESSKRLRERHPLAKLYAMRVGYKAVFSFAGYLERTA